MKNLYNKNIKTLEKEIGEDIYQKMEKSPLLIDTVKMAILPKSTYRFNEIPHQNPKILFKGNWKNNFHFVNLRLDTPWTQ